MKDKIRRILKLMLGWTLVALGIIGLFLPFLQGFLLVIAGLALLAREYPWARRFMLYLKKTVKSRARKANDDSVQ